MRFLARMRRVRSACLCITGEHVIDLEGNFGAIGRLELAHDVADMDLDGAFPQVEFVGNDLVGLAPAQRFHHLRLAQREHARQRLRLRAGFHQPPHGNHTAGGNEDATRHGQPDCLYADTDADRGWNKAPYAIFESLQNLRQLIRIGQNNQGNLSKFGRKAPDFLLHLRIADTSSAKIEQNSANRRNLVASGRILLDAADRQHLQSHAARDKALGKAFPLKGTIVDDDERSVRLARVLRSSGGLGAGVMYAME